MSRLGYVPHSDLLAAKSDLEKQMRRTAEMLQAQQSDHEKEKRELTAIVDQIVGKFANITVRPDFVRGRYAINTEISEELVRYGFNDEVHKKLIVRSIGEQVCSELLRSKFIQR
jgi:hypothetical protein